MIPFALLLLANPPAAQTDQPAPSDLKPPVACSQSSQPQANAGAPDNYPSSYDAAADVQQQIDRWADCATQPDVRSSYGAATQWEEVDRRSAADPNGNSAKGKRKPKTSKSRQSPLPKP